MIFDIELWLLFHVHNTISFWCTRKFLFEAFLVINGANIKSMLKTDAKNIFETG
jgi:hypothetical protein